MVDPFLSIGFAIARLVMRWCDQGEVADGVGDVESASRAMVRLTRRKDVDPLAKAIKVRLTDRLSSTPKDRADDIRAAAHDVASLMDKFSKDRNAVLAAALSPDEFREWAMKNGAAKLRSFTAEHAEPAFDDVLEAACAEFARLAPASGAFVPAALMDLLEHAQVLPEMFAAIQELLQTSRDARGPTATEKSADRVLIVEQSDSLQQRRAAWMAEVLRLAGARVSRVDGTVDPSFADACSTSIVLLPGPIDRGVAARHSSPDRHVVSIAFGMDPDGAEADGIRLDNTPASATQLVEELRRRFPNMVLRDLPSPHHIRIDPSTSLPRLQQLTGQALEDAAEISHPSLDGGVNLKSLYVRRDLESNVLERLEDRSRIIVVGEAGVGKTSLLWGLAERLVQDAQRPVYFVPAAHLKGTPTGEARISPDELVTAVQHDTLFGEAPIVLIDTADLLANDRDSLALLSAVLDRIGIAGGKTVVTSRPVEASRITDDSAVLLRLEPYDLDSRTAGEVSEFDRAIASHAVTYCRVPGETSEIADQVRSAAIRQTTLGAMARTPLLLRMLFQLYAPGLIPADIEPTKLYERYWAARVQGDRRHWGTFQDPIADGFDVDTSITAKALAHEMLRSGRPEVLPDDVPRSAEQSTDFEQHLRVLVARGVLLRRVDGAVSFFHQTFFEYAAAQDLLDHDTALQAILKRANAHPDDAFLLAVLEQVWLSAFRRADTRRIAERSVVKTLSSPSVDGALERIALRVAAGSPMPAELQTAVLELLHTADEPSVKEFLLKRPRPGAAWEDVDDGAFCVLRERGGPYWYACIEVLQRLYRTHPTVADQRFNDLRGRLSPAFPDAEDLKHDRTQHFLRVLAETQPDTLIDLLVTAHRTRARPAEQFSTVVTILAAVPNGWANRAAEVADMWAGRLGTSPAHAALHARALTQAKPADWEQVMVNAAQALQRIAADRDHLSAYPAYVWGLCLALDEWDDATRDADVLDLLFAQTSPQVHKHLHHGWLTAPANRSGVVRRRMASVLAAGLPAARNQPGGATGRWADSVRRLLGHPDTRPETRRSILQDFWRQWDLPDEAPNVWGDRSMLQYVLLPAASAGYPPAWEFLRGSGSPATVGDVTSSAPWRAVIGTLNITGQEPHIDELLALFATWGEFTKVETVLESGEIELSDSTAGIITANAVMAVRTGSPETRRIAARVLDKGLRHRILPFPDVDNMTAMLDEAKDNGTLLSLVGPAVVGVHAGVYSRQQIAAILRQGMVIDSEGNLAQTGDSLACRRELLRLAAPEPGLLTVDELVTTAFLRPVTGDIVHSLTGALIPAVDGRHRWSADDRISLVIRVGQGLAAGDIPNRAPKDTANRWRAPLFYLLAGLRSDLTERLLEALPRMHPRFGAAVAYRLVIRRNEATESRLRRLLTDPALDDEVKRQLNLALQSSEYEGAGWWTLDEDLALPDEQ